MKKNIYLLVMLAFIAGANAQTNLLANLNGDFETGNANYWRYLNVKAGVVNNLTAVMSTDVHSGNYAALVEWVADPAIQEIVFDLLPNVVAGRKLTYKAWAKLVSGPAFMLRMHCTFFDDTNAIKGDFAEETWILSNIYTEHTWVLPAVPAGATKVNVGFRAYNANGSRFPAATVSCLIDDVQLLEPPKVYGPNLLGDMNGSFENGNIDSWRFLQLGTTATPSTAVISTDAHSGQSAAKVTFEKFLTNFDDLYDVPYGSNPRQKMDLFLPKTRTQNTKLVILIPGGGWRGGDKINFDYWCGKFADAGIAAVTINYRYANVADHVGYVEMLDDIDKAINFLTAKSTEYIFNTSKICLFGHSAGAHLSQLYTYRNNPLNQVNNVVSLSGTCDLTDPVMLSDAGMNAALTVLVNSNDNAKWLDASPITHANAVTTLLYHGNLDELIPYQQSIRLFDVIKSKNARNRLTILNGVTHSIGFDDMIKIVNETVTLINE